MREWLHLVLSQREEVLLRCGSPGLEPVPLGRYPLLDPPQPSTDPEPSDQTPPAKPRKVTTLDDTRAQPQKLKNFCRNW